VYGPLAETGSGLLETLVVFLDNNSSVEATARALFVHANTVRYRLKRIQETTGYSPTDARDAYVLRMALTLGRLLPDGRENPRG
jgi:DNA-binding PucR family transcriptional regulator